MSIHQAWGNLGDTNMPSLFRLLFFLSIVFAVVYGGIFALATFAEPTQREITVRIPQDRINPR